MTAETLQEKDVIILRRLANINEDLYCAFPPMSEMSKTGCVQPYFESHDKWGCTRKFLDYAKDKGWNSHLYNLETGATDTQEGEFTDLQITAMIEIEHRRDDVKANLYGAPDIWECHEREIDAVIKMQETLMQMYPFIVKFEIVVKQ